MKNEYYKSMMPCKRHEQYTADFDLGYNEAREIVINCDNFYMVAASVNEQIGLTEKSLHSHFYFKGKYAALLDYGENI